MEAVNKVKSTVTGAPLGALIGAVIGYQVAKHLEYHKTLMVVSFSMVGLLIGGSVGKSLKN